MKFRQGVLGLGLLLALLGVVGAPVWGVPIVSPVDWGDEGFEVLPSGPVEFVEADRLINPPGDGDAIRGAGQRTAILDTGLNSGDATLVGKIAAAVDFTGDSTTNPGHGTHVAKNVLSIAPDSEVVDVRVIASNGFGTWEWVRDGIQWVNAHRETYNITAINMSIGGGGRLLGVPDDPVLQEVEAELATFVAHGGFVGAAAGNGFDPGVQGLLYPAISSYAVAVGSVYDGVYAGNPESGPDLIWSGSQRINPALKPSYMLCPPGGATSFSTPYLTGASLLLREVYQNRYPGQAANQELLLAYMQNYGVEIWDTEPPHHDSVENTGYLFYRLNVWDSAQGIVSGSIPIPEAPQLALLGVGLALLVGQRRRKRWG